MRGNNISMNFAHSAGCCGAAVTSNGVALITTGTDASVRPHDIRGKTEKHPEPWWQKDPSDEPELEEMSIADLHEKPVNAVAIAPNDKTMATGSDDGFVRMFSLSCEEEPSSADGKNNGYSLKVSGNLVVACARFGGPVRALDFSPTGAFLAAAGEEPGLVKIIMTAQPSNVNILRCTDKDKGGEAIVSLAFDPNSDYVVSVGERGSACIWSVESGSFLALIALNERLAKSITWSPDGSLLVVGTDKGAVVVNRDSWIFDHLLTDAGDQDDEDEDSGFANVGGKNVVTAVAWSSSGRYVLCGCGDASVVAWDMEKRTVINRWKGETAVQKVIWHPKENGYILVDEIGQFGIVTEVTPSHLPKPFEGTSRIQLPALPEIEGKTKRKSKKNTEYESDTSDDETIVRSKSAQKKKDKRKEKLKKVVEKAKGDSGSESNGDGEESGPFQFAFDADDLDADDEEELGSRKTGRVLSDTDNSADENDDESETKSKKRSSRKRSKSQRSRLVYANTSIQAPFMPSSTPLSERSVKKKRILCWNLVGAVISFDESTHDVVEVEFADASKRSVGIKDHFGYSMGCLSSTGVLLGAPKAKAHGSLIYFRPFSSWSANSDWTQFLEGDENAVVLGLGNRFAAVGTTPNNYVRIFSLSGIQTDVFGVAGPIVTMTAFEDHLAIVCGVPGTSLLRFELLLISDTAEVKSVICNGDIVLSAKSRLEWVGFTPRAKELSVYDSKGNLFLLCNKRHSRRWVPMIQNAAASAKCDWLWVAAVNSESIIGAPCHSNERYPPAKPRPALRTVPLIAPVLQPKAKNGHSSVSERYFRSKLELSRVRNEKARVEEEFDSDDDEVAQAEDEVYKAETLLDKCILALMEDACRSEHNLRAFDLATRLHTKVSFKYAVQLANYYKRSALASRVEEISRHKLAIIEEESQEKKRQKDLLKPREGSGASRLADVDINADYQEDGDTLVNSPQANSTEKYPSVLEGVSEDEEDVLMRGKTTETVKSKNQVLGRKRHLPLPPTNRSQKTMKETINTAAGSNTPSRSQKPKRGSFVNRFKK